MASVKLVAIPCQLYPSVFSSERVFEVVLKNGERHQGVAPRYFCWNDRGELIAADEATDGVHGMVAAKDLCRGTADYSVVEVPDGEVLAVEPRDVRERPTRIEPPNLPPIQKERPSHVSVGS